MKVRRVGVNGVAVCSAYAFDQQIVSHNGSSRDLAKPSHPNKSNMPMPSTTLPEELVEEILVRVPPDEPAHLVRVTLVCKAWNSIVSNETFRHCYRRFHRTPLLQGYIYNDRYSTVQFVPTTSMAVSAVCKVYSTSSPVALDCRHGHVLIQVQAEDNQDSSGLPDSRLIVWDPIAGSQQHLSVPDYPQYPHYIYAGAVLCAKDNCDHLDCYGGPFRVVLLGMSYDYIYDFDSDKANVQTWASVYSSETGTWSAPTTPNIKTNKRIDDTTPSLLIGDTLYFNAIREGYSIVKYDLCKHELSVVDLPLPFEPIVIKENDGGLGFATMFHNCIRTCSWQVDNKGVSGSLLYTVLNLGDTLLPQGDHPSDLICIAEGTNTAFIAVKGTGLFTLDLKSRQVRKIGEEDFTYYHGTILPYVSFYAPKY